MPQAVQAHERRQSQADPLQARPHVSDRKDLAASRDGTAQQLQQQASVKQQVPAVPIENVAVNTAAASATCPNSSDPAACKAFFDALPVGMHVLQSMRQVSACCAAVYACDAVAVALDGLLKQPVQDPGTQMPPRHDSEEWPEYARALARGNGEDGDSDAAAALAATRMRKMQLTMIESVVLCWDTERTFVVPVRLRMPEKVPTSCPGPLECFAHVAYALAAPVPKVLFSAKTVVSALRRLGCQGDLQRVLQPWLPAKGLGMEITGPLADVRVAAGMLGPGNSFVSDEPEKFEEVGARISAMGGAKGPAEQLFYRLHMLPGWVAAFPKRPPATPPPAASFDIAAGQHRRVSPERLAGSLAAAREALFAMAMHKQIAPALAATQVATALQRIEWPLVRVIAELEWRGMPVDSDAITAELEPLLAVQAELVKAWETETRKHGIHNVLPPENASRQVPVLLWDKLKLSVPPGTEVCGRLAGDASLCCLHLPQDTVQLLHILLLHILLLHILLLQLGGLKGQLCTQIAATRVLAVGNLLHSS